MRGKLFIRLLILFAFTLMVSSCGGGSPGSPGTGGGGSAGSMLLVEAVTPSATFVRTSDLTSTETVQVEIGNYDLPNQKGTATAVTFTKYTVEYKPLEPGCPHLDNRYYNATFYAAPNVDPDCTAEPVVNCFTLTFFDYYTKLQYRYANDPHLYRYNVVVTMTGYNVFSKKVTVVFQFNITTQK